MLHATNIFIAANIGAQLTYAGFGYALATLGALVMLSIGTLTIHVARA